MTEPGRGWARGCACCARRQDAGHVSRRRFLAEGIAAGAALGLGVSTASAQAENPRRIDVHHHLAPPRWIADVVVGRNTGEEGGPLGQRQNGRATCTDKLASR